MTVELTVVPCYCMVVLYSTVRTARASVPVYRGHHAIALDRRTTVVALSKLLRVQHGPVSTLPGCTDSLYCTYSTIPYLQGLGAQTIRTALRLPLVVRFKHRSELSHNTVRCGRHADCTCYRPFPVLFS